MGSCIVALTRDLTVQRVLDLSAFCIRRTPHCEALTWNRKINSRNNRDYRRDVVLQRRNSVDEIFLNAWIGWNLDDAI
jgi:hypothetical protein